MSNSNALNNYMPYILDANGNLILNFVNISNAVNFVNIYNNATGSAPVIQGTGTDPNVTLNLQGTGTGGVQVQGTGTNTDATPTFVGEYIESVIAAASAVTFTNGTQRDLTSISLAAGDWDVWGNINFPTVGGTAPQSLFAWISSTSATVPDASLYAAISLSAAGGVLSSGNGINAPMRRFSLASTTTIYISGLTSATSGNATGCGRICARRRR